MRRVRLSEWARQEGIARITAYRMLKRGILPVPSEKSPTGRWYVLLPEERHERVALYTRAAPGPDHTALINEQIAKLSEWASSRSQPVYLVVREVAAPFLDRMPKLARLLADQQISEIVIENLEVLGHGQYELLVATLAPQGRTITALNQRQKKSARNNEVRETIRNLCRLLYGQEAGDRAARRAFEQAASNA